MNVTVKITSEYIETPAARYGPVATAARPARMEAIPPRDTIRARPSRQLVERGDDHRGQTDQQQALEEEQVDLGIVHHLGQHAEHRGDPQQRRPGGGHHRRAAGDETLDEQHQRQHGDHRSNHGDRPARPGRQVQPGPEGHTDGTRHQPPPGASAAGWLRQLPDGSNDVQPGDPPARGQDRDLGDHQADHRSRQQAGRLDVETDGQLQPSNRSPASDITAAATPMPTTTPAAAAAMP